MKLFTLDDILKIGLSEKADGNMKIYRETEADEVVENRARFLGLMGLTLEMTRFVRVQYDGVSDFCQFAHVTGNHALDQEDEAIPRADGLLFAEYEADLGAPPVGLFLPLADCVGVVLYDAQKKALMMVHCGRQTILQDGAYKAVGYVTEWAGTRPEDVLAWLSPSARKENYPLQEMGGVSLQEAVVEQLTRAGVAETSIQRSEIDTTTDEQYFSHSQGDTEKRFAIAAVLDAPRVETEGKSGLAKLIDGWGGK